VPTLVITQDKVLGFVMDGELQLHERPPFDPERQTPAATAVCKPSRRFGDIIAQLRRGYWQNIPFKAVLGVPGGAAVFASWKVVGVRDELGMQQQGWTTSQLSGQRVPRFVSTGDGLPEYYLAARLYDDVGALDLRPVIG
jgi:hypothetical protein